MALSNDFLIDQVEVFPLNVGLTDSFTISQGSVREVNNLLVRLITRSGVTGYGEIAPFSELSGEDKETCIQRFNDVQQAIVGSSLLEMRRISSILEEALPDSPAVRCGIEVAMLDSFTRNMKIPLWSYLGGRKMDLLKTDITLPILTIERSMELVKKWYDKDFRTFKIKVGAEYQKEIDLVNLIHTNFKETEFILDANQGFNENEAIDFLRELVSNNVRVILYEQPVNRYNLEAMGRIKKLFNVPVAADESVFSIEDLRNVITHNAADVVNLKIMKTGVFNALKIASTAQSMGLKLMIGGMVETRVAMGCSAAIAMGYAQIDYIDLDTPLLMEFDPFIGGYSYCGPDIKPWDTPGLGLEPIFL